MKIVTRRSLFHATQSSAHLLNASLKSCCSQFHCAQSWNCQQGTRWNSSPEASPHLLSHAVDNFIVSSDGNLNKASAGAGVQRPVHITWMVLCFELEAFARQRTGCGGTLGFFCDPEGCQEVLRSACICSSRPKSN